MLIINSADIEKVASLKEFSDTVEESLKIYDSGDFLMPDRMHIHYEGNTLLLMPSFVKDYFGTKLVSVFPKNIQKNKPVIYGSVILNDGDTGEPLAMMNGGKLTAMRTGAVGSMGVRYLSHESAQSVGIVGAGIQGIHQAIFACSEREITNIYVFDFSKANMDHFSTQVNKFYPNVKIHHSDSVEELVQNSEIIITATSSEKPVLPDTKELLDGKTIIGIGSYKPNMQELPQCLFSLVDQCFVDTEFAKIETGDLSIPLENNWITEDRIKPVSDLITKKALAESDTRLFKSVGMALFDLIVARMIYKNAINKNIGTHIDI